MRSSPPDAARLAAGVLLDELAEVLDGTRPQPALPPGDALRDWAASGAMHLTGRADGPPRPSPGAPASWARAAGALAGLPAELAGRLLAERAALSGRGRDAPRSVGGAFRALPAREGWFGLSLARPADRELLPALTGGPVDAPVWPALAAWVAEQPADAALARAIALGLPAAVVGAAEPARPAVRATRGGPAARRHRPVVVDLSALWAGPLCAHVLGLAGARVIKVESSDRPDGARRGGPGFYDRLHAGHEAVALDFGTAGGRADLHTLVRWADVVIEGSRPRALAQLGIDAAAAVAAGTVWVGITAYGRVPGERIGFGDDVAAAAGLVDRAAGPPTPVGDAIADPLTGLTAAAAARWALASRSGWLLDISMHAVCAQAAALVPAADAPVRQDGGGRWWAGTEHPVPVMVPVARPPSGRAAPTGAHTASVLSAARSGVGPG